MKRNILLIILASGGMFQQQACLAQALLRGKIVNEKEIALSEANIILLKDDSIMASAVTDKGGVFKMEKVYPDEYVVSVWKEGYNTLTEALKMPAHEHSVTFRLFPEMKGTLEEVEVTADRSEKVQRTATGKIFYLSEKAKNSGDPFRALKEIPGILSNEALQTIQMENGSAPLILVNGIAFHSGVAAIDPKEIISVEVRDIVSARYLKSGIKHIIDIKLKKKTRPYSFLQLATRHDIPLHNGMGVLYFDVGNPKVALYGRWAATYLYDDDASTDLFQQNEGYAKSTSQHNRNNKRNGFGELQFRWMPSERDYVVAHVYGNGTLNKQKADGEGEMTEKGKMNTFQMESYNRDNSYIFTGSLFHKHTFNPNSTLETMLSYNYNHNQNRSERKENHPDYLYEDFFKYKNRRHSYYATTNYLKEWNKVNSLNVGANFRFLNDRIHQVTENLPVFRHKEWDGYAYAVFGSKYKNLYYMLSAGVEGIRLEAGEASHHYFKPRASASATYTFSDNHSLRMGYTLTNTTPAVSMLNPYNTSSDSLVVTKGNPYLLPAQNQKAEVEYTFNKKGFYLTPSLAYAWNTDLIETDGYSENNIYTSTYRNSGVFRRLSAGLSASYRFGVVRIYAYGSHAWNYFTGQDAKRSISVGYGGSASVGKWSFNVNADYSGNEYSQISRTRHYAPSYALLQVTYNFTKNFYISTAIENSFGTQRNVTETWNGKYYSRLSQRLTDMSFCPWVLIRYTLRKNTDRRPKENRVVNPQEQGIKL